MAINEFRWGVKPRIPSWWHTTHRHDGFEVEITNDWIELRKECEGHREAEQKLAQQIVEAITTRIGLQEKTHFTAKLGFVSEFDPQSNRRETIALLSGTISAGASAHGDLTLVASGSVITDSRKERMVGLFQFINIYSRNKVLRRMSDYLLEYHSDEHKKLAPLFDVIEIAAEVFGSLNTAATSLGVGIRRMKEARKIINDSSIRHGRHRGQEVGMQRDPTAEESKLCEAVALQIVSEYTKMVERGLAPA